MFLILWAIVNIVFAQGNERIENGKIVSASSDISRSVAFLSFSSGGFCSASFLSKKTLLTAGHCLVGTSASSVTVMVRDKNSQWHSITAQSVNVHPSYVESQSSYGILIKNDVAIVQLAETFPFAVRPLKLAAPSGMSGGKYKAVADLGYGIHHGNANGGTLRWGSMKATTMPVVYFGDRIGLAQFKTDSNNNVCSGDSGGPVVLGSSSSKQQVAVHSISNGCTSSSSDAYSELVWPHKQWIQSQIQ